MYIQKVGFDLVTQHYIGTVCNYELEQKERQNIKLPSGGQTQTWYKITDLSLHNTGLHNEIQLFIYTYT